MSVQNLIIAADQKAILDAGFAAAFEGAPDRKSTRLNSSHAT